MSKSLTIRIPDALWSAIEEYGLEHYPGGDSFDKTQAALSLLRKGLGMPAEESGSLSDIVRCDELGNAIGALRTELVGTLSVLAARVERLERENRELIALIELNREDSSPIPEGQGVSAASLAPICG